VAVPHRARARAFTVVVKILRLVSNRGFTRIPGAGRLRDFLVNTVTPKRRMCIRLPHFEMYVNPSDTGLTRELIAGRSYEDLETMVFLEAIAPGMVIVDIGANVGYYTLSAATHAGATVYAFEPEPSTFQYLRDNVQLNGLQRVFPLNEALSDKPGHVAFFVHGSNLGKHSLIRSDEAVRTVTVPATTLDEFVRAKELTRLDVVKLDVEGAEALVLAGAMDTISRFRPVVFLEFTPAWVRKTGYDPDRVLERLEQLHYEILMIDARANRLRPTSRTELVDIERSSRWMFQTNLLLRPLATAAAPA
jgi:FkbM family methyltransferase